MEIEKVSPLRKAIDEVFSRLGITNSIIAKEYFESPDFTHSCCILEYGKEKYVYFTDMPEDGIIDIITWKQKRYSDGSRLGITNSIIAKEYFESRILPIPVVY
jgi:hypothetical protein